MTSIEVKPVPPSLAPGFGEIFIGRMVATNTINANEGNDVLIGGNGNDILTAALADDLINSGAGNDIVIENAVVGTSVTREELSSRATATIQVRTQSQTSTSRTIRSESSQPTSPISYTGLTRNGDSRRYQRWYGR